jgi:hypothetical protein
MIIKFVTYSICHLFLFWSPRWRGFSSVEWQAETVIHVRNYRFGHIAIAREPYWDDCIGFEAYFSAPVGFGRVLAIRLGWDVLSPQWPIFGLAKMVNSLD